MITAFIPVRGGSKSIPQKNIKDFCGKPLVYWTLKAASDNPQIDKVILSTDSDEIINTINKFKLPKLEFFDRDPSTATDGATTESAMLDYILQSTVNDNDIFILLQATSPFTTSQNIQEALNQYKRGFDSVLSVVPFKRFIWDENGSKNYNYNNRKRRQDVDSEFMENGALYINTTGNIKQYQNRLSGNIGLYIMPEYTGVEIDEPDDWEVAELLFKKYNKQRTTTKNFKLVLTDVDGVLTDSGMYYSEQGGELKKFNTRDGMAFELLRNAGIKTGMITSEVTEIVSKRAKKLKVDYLYQGKRDGGKLSAALEICGKENITLQEVAYIGDDINCKELLEQVGFAACPSDADERIKQIQNICILKTKGGYGVFREFVSIL